MDLSKKQIEIQVEIADSKIRGLVCRAYSKPACQLTNKISLRIILVVTLIFLIKNYQSAINETSNIKTMATYTATNPSSRRCSNGGRKLISL